MLVDAHLKETLDSFVKEEFAEINKRINKKLR